MDFDQFCICINIYNIQLGIVKLPFSSIHYRVAALECRQNLVSVEYLEYDYMTKFCRCININII